MESQQKEVETMCSRGRRPGGLRERSTRLGEGVADKTCVRRKVCDAGAADRKKKSATTGRKKQLEGRKPGDRGGGTGSATSLAKKSRGRRKNEKATHAEHYEKYQEKLTGTGILGRNWGRMR